jgi:hypothetical protein
MEYDGTNKILLLWNDRSVGFHVLRSVTSLLTIWYAVSTTVWSRGENLKGAISYFKRKVARTFLTME